ncbi:4-alpha-glucanotransferase [Zavarzinia sp. CC-PAN008]|uniref:4-alpha-glucanotransferase n=1 Tax=Zavarzinia sp. CC-PAN008 TaxID=3243332 RepID=UPI003F742418
MTGSYVDAFGRVHVPPPETVARIVEAQGPPAPPGLLPPLAVVRQGRPPRLRVPLAPGLLRFRVTSEDGTAIACEAEVRDRMLSLPDLEPGLYRLEASLDGQRAETLLLVAPATMHLPPALAAGRRLWGLAVQFYGLRSAHNCGIGDFGDLARLIRLAAARGASAIGLSPLHLLFSERPEDASPYAPNSRAFLNPIHVDLDAIPDFPGLEAAGLAGRAATLRASPLVDYAGVASLKREALSLAFRAFQAHASDSRRHAFATFRASLPGLEDLARFEVLRPARGGFWRDWSDDVLPEGSQEAVDLVAWTQWQAHAQLACCQDLARAQGMAIGLYLDVAVGIDAGGFDAFAAPGSFAHGVSLGAPPDPINTAGQSWGLAPFAPGPLEASGFAAWRNVLAGAMRHAGAVRIDHAIGLQRQFWVPWGVGPADGAYVDFPRDGMLAATALESDRWQSLVIGEDLGTLPPGLQDALADWGVLSYRLLMFERAADGRFRPPRDYPRRALVSFTTHDLPTLQGWLTGHDLWVKRSLGLDPGETEESRREAHRHLADALEAEGLGRAIDLESVTRFLARTPSDLLMIPLEDLCADPDQPNVPGTTTEHPNWRRRARLTIEELEHDGTLLHLADVLRAEGRAGPT